MVWLKSNKNHDSDALSDDELLTQYRSSQDTTLIEQLFNRYIHLVYGVCLKYLKDREIAQDITMQVFERMISYLKDHEVRNFKSWLYTITKNDCLMYLRKTTTVDLNNNTLFMESEDVLHPLDGPDEEQLSIMEKCIEELIQNQKKCVQLFYLENNSYQQIADVTGFEVKKIKSYLQNGRRNIKICMEKHEEKA